MHTASTRFRFGCLRRCATLLCGILLLGSPAVASTGRDAAVVDLPELTAAIDPAHQVALRLSLQMSGPRAEKLARERLLRLRHALVLRLAGLDGQALDAVAVEQLLEDYRGDANSVLGAQNAVRGVLVQKFVVQGK